jgi:pyridoxal phosphate enzyme (YggS family)
VTRAQELADNLAEVEARIVAACAAAGRPRADVTLVAVTKTWPTSDCVLLRDLGVTELGENRDQEAARKAREVDGVRWHFVGSIQTNKARSVTSYVDVVHSVDRTALVDALSAGATRAGREVLCLLQVSLDADPTRGGALPEDLAALADAVEDAAGLRLGGLMAVAPLGGDPAEAFARLAAAGADLTAVHPSATVLSAGMTGDLEQAVAAGATHLRVGTALLGHRSPPLR